ncbi:MAG: alpha amylase N-terminal ig-like domain-containing protein [Armatimonadetes bacterium]|nr:alpha amylase N-terminal ig-like domain-containing protein [Armatimonadota bacterium]
MRRVALQAFVLVWVLSMLWAQAQIKRPVTFRFETPTPAEKVYLAGTFNEWQPRATPMHSTDGGRTWSLTLELEPGVYQYKFVVNGTEWHIDPNAPVVDDGNGNLNSVLWVEPDGYNRPARLGDGIFTRSAIDHNPADLRDRNVAGETLYLRLRTRKQDVAEVRLLYTQNGRVRTLSMKPAVSDELYTYYTATLPDSDYAYAFLLIDGRARLWLDASGLRPAPTPPRFQHAFKHRRGENRFEAPEWVQDAIFYQIVPDRFYNADPSNDPPNNQPIDFTGRREGDGFHGGDLKGIIEKLDYLQELGITTLYLTPVFASVTHHNYDTDDYETVDPQLGTNEDLETLARRLHQNGFRLVLDGVFNHVGIYFFAFQDLLQHQERSPYKDWFIVERFPVKVEPNPAYWAWWNIPYMPKLNHENPIVRRYLLGVVERWTRRLGLDGWRLDVANEVPDRFWREFRPVVKRANPEAVIIGEIWGDAGRWLQGDMFDSVMNYLWRGAVLGWIAHRNLRPSQFDMRMRDLQIRYPRQSLYAMYNMLSSHDTPRFWRECGGDERRVRLGFLLQMTAIGAPAIYYGDEIGMDGGGIPDNRRPMEWNPTPQQRALREFVRHLIRVRQAIPALRRGDWQTLLIDDARNLYAYARTMEPKTARGSLAIVVINNGEQPAEIELPVPLAEGALSLVASTAPENDLRDTYPVSNGRVALTLAPMTGIVLIPSYHTTGGLKR